MLLDPHVPVKLVNAQIVDVEHGAYFPPQTSLVIQDGKIIAMPGRDGETDRHAAEAVIDLHGKTIIPGLFNTHSHLQFIAQSEYRTRQIERNFNECIERGITNVRDTLSYDLLENRAWMDKMNRGEVLGPRIHQAVHVSPVGGTYAPRLNPLTRLSFSMLGIKLIDYKLKHCGAVVFPPGAGLQQVREAVDRAVDERGAAAIKFCDQPEHFVTFKPGAQVMSFEQLAAAADQAEKRGIPTTMHNVTVAGFRQGVQAGLTSLAHIPIDSELAVADAALLLGSQTFIEPTLTVGYFMSYAVQGSMFQDHPELQRVDAFREQSYRELVEETWLPELRARSMGMHTALKQGKTKVFGLFDISQPFIYYSKAIPIGGKNLALLAKHGALSRIACGNDAGPSNCSAASIHHELAMFDFVLNRDETPTVTPADLLRIATIQSARSLGLADQFGSLEVGKAADLVVVDGDPLQDYHLLGKPVQALFMDGKLLVNHCNLAVSQPMTA